MQCASYLHYLTLHCMVTKFSGHIYHARSRIYFECVWKRLSVLSLCFASMRNDWALRFARPIWMHFILTLTLTLTRSVSYSFVRRLDARTRYMHEVLDLGVSIVEFNFTVRWAAFKSRAFGISYHCKASITVVQSFNIASPHSLRWE